MTISMDDLVSSTFNVGDFSVAFYSKYIKNNLELFFHRNIFVGINIYSKSFLINMDSIHIDFLGIFF